MASRGAKSPRLYVPSQMRRLTRNRHRPEGARLQIGCSPRRRIVVAPAGLPRFVPGYPIFAVTIAVSAWLDPRVALI